MQRPLRKRGWTRNPVEMSLNAANRIKKITDEKASSVKQVLNADAMATEAIRTVTKRCYILKDLVHRTLLMTSTPIHFLCRVTRNVGIVWMDGGGHV